jgi:hypothetical protein
MNPSPKTLQIFLPQGGPSGIRIAELTTRIVQAVACPRTELKALFKRPEIKHIATYFLFGGSDGDSKPESYIGQTEDLILRLKSHDAKKEFWHTVVFLISRTHSFTQAHIRWMEWKGIAAAIRAKRYNLSNGNGGSEPFVTEAMHADLDEIFETGSILLEALGYPVFRPFIEAKSSELPGFDQEEWFLAGVEASARGTYSPDGFVVREGSTCRVSLSNAAKGGFIESMRDRLVAEKTLVEVNGRYVFTEDYLFKTPSGAATVVLGRNANGWTEWRNKDGVVIDQIRKNAAEAAKQTEEG